MGFKFSVLAFRLKLFYRSWQFVYFLVGSIFCLPNWGNLNKERRMLDILQCACSALTDQQKQPLCRILWYFWYKTGKSLDLASPGCY